MLKNAKLKEKEEEYMAEVRNHLKPHTLQLYALKELYKLDELEVPDFEHEHLNSALAGELIKKFASDVADNDKCGEGEEGEELLVDADALGLGHCVGAVRAHFHGLRALGIENCRDDHEDGDDGGHHLPQDAKQQPSKRRTASHHWWVSPGTCPSSP